MHFLKLIPNQRTLRLFAREHGFAETVLDGVERDLDLVANMDFKHPIIGAELFDRDNAFGLESGIDDDHVGTDFHNGAKNDRSRLEVGDGLAPLEHFGKAFGHRGFGYSIH